MTYDGSDSLLVHKWIDATEVASFRLCVVGLDGAPTPLDVWPVGIGETEIREAVEESAARHCNVMGGSHAYVLQAVEKETGAILASHCFRVSAEALPGASVLASEPANVGGVTAQLMRHQEAIMSSTVIAWDKLGRTATGMIERADRRAARSEAAYMRVVELHQELIEGSEQRKDDNRRADTMLEIKRNSAKQLTALAPVILESIVKKVAPEGLDRASAHTARTFFESLTQEQLHAVLGACDAEQQKIVIHLLNNLAREAEGVESADDGGTDAKH